MIQQKGHKGSNAMQFCLADMWETWEGKQVWQKQPNNYCSCLSCIVYQKLPTPIEYIPFLDWLWCFIDTLSFEFSGCLFPWLILGQICWWDASHRHQQEKANSSKGWRLVFRTGVENRPEMESVSCLHFSMVIINRWNLFGSFFTLLLNSCRPWNARKLSQEPYQCSEVILQWFGQGWDTHQAGNFVVIKNRVLPRFGRQNMYDKMLEYWVTIRERATHEEEHEQAEVHKSVGKVGLFSFETKLGGKHYPQLELQGYKYKSLSLFAIVVYVFGRQMGQWSSNLVTLIAPVLWWKVPRPPRPVMPRRMLQPQLMLQKPQLKLRKLWRSRGLLLLFFASKSS